MKPFATLRQHLLSATLLFAVACISTTAMAQTSYTVGATSTGVPFTFLDIKTNKLQGMMVDTVTLIGKNAGFSVNVQQTPFAALIPSLTSNKIDIIAAAMLKTAARAQIVDFSDPVYSYGEGLFVNAEDKRGVETVFRGVHAPLARPGHLSHLERPNYDFARYLAEKVSS